MKGGAAKVEVASLVAIYTNDANSFTLKAEGSQRRRQAECCWVWCHQDSCCSKHVRLHVICAFVLFSSENTTPSPSCSPKIMSDWKTSSRGHREHTVPLPRPNPGCGRHASASHFLSFRLPPSMWAERGLCSPAERSKRW